jgi:hypothetical protein
VTSLAKKNDLQTSVRSLRLARKLQTELLRTIFPPTICHGLGLNHACSDRPDPHTHQDAFLKIRYPQDVEGAEQAYHRNGEPIIAVICWKGFSKISMPNRLQFLSITQYAELSISAAVSRAYGRSPDREER